MVLKLAAGDSRNVGEKADSEPGAQKVQGKSKKIILHQKLRKY